MKKYIAMAAMAALCAPLALADKAQPENPDSTGFTFTDIKVVKTTPVRDQNKSGTCWCFATTSFLEDELLRKEIPAHGRYHQLRPGRFRS